MESTSHKVYQMISQSRKTPESYEIRLILLEKAHLISQPLALPHFIVHWEMLKLALRFKQWREFFGQIPRLFLAMPGSWLGKAPKGNVGSTKMGIFEESKHRIDQL